CPGCRLRATARRAAGGVHRRGFDQGSSRRRCSTDRRLTRLQARPPAGPGTAFLSAPGSSPRRTFRTFLIVGLITLALVVYGALNVGRFLTKEDSIQKADAIAVLAGTRLDRPLEAVDLYQAGYAPSIVLTHETPERALGVAAGRGVTLPVKADEARDVMMKL